MCIRDRFRDEFSDKLAGELNIIGEDFSKGLWRLRGETSIFESEKPRKWKK